MKYVYLTVDVEEWFDLNYLNKYNIKSTNTEVVPLLIDFLDLLDRLQIKATFFVLANLAERNCDIIREISGRGHEIACHGLDHGLLNEKDNETFYDEITKAKRLIENQCNCTVNGYRASCFSLDREKLDLLIKAGFKYDSSKITFSQHPLYRDLNLDGFSLIDDLVHKKQDFFEYEIPTFNIWKLDIPISGGGYLRLLPYWLIKILLKRYRRKNKNFLLYVHPFELTDIPLPFPKDVSFKDKFRANIGRKGNLKKLKKVLLLLKKSGGEFRTLGKDRRKRLEMEKASCNIF